MIATIQNKRGTAAEWTSANPILALAELGLEKDTRKFKFGDGVTAWNSLAYAVASDAAISAKVTVANQTARYALTTVEVQNGDTVFQTDTSTLYLVTDQTALNGAGGYTALATVTAAQISDSTAAGREVITTNYAPYNAGNITGSTTLDRNNGEHQKTSLTGDVTLQAPSNGAEGKKLKLLLLASGVNRSLALHASILLPSDSAAIFPKTLTSAKKYYVTLQHDGSAWHLTGLVGGY